uniref:Cytochrome P450 n=1 Tax=Arcella intermedia TaxID=1963864 RepID=A0A6B2L8R8_9EUKA
MNKAFSNNSLFFEPLRDKIGQCMDLWKPGEPVFISEFIQKMTLDALGSSVLGRDFDSLHGNLEGPLHAYETITGNLPKPYMIMFPGLLNLPFFRNVRQSMKDFDSYCWKIINEAKENSLLGGNSIISLMLNSGLPDNVMRDNIGVFFLAGHETTASTINWEICMLATYPEVTKRLREELIQKTNNFTIELTYGIIKELTYLDWFIKETIRLYPAAPRMAGRIANKDMVIGDWFVPAKTKISIDYSTMMHDKSIWGNPLVFDPERWSPERLTKEQRKCYLPFSYGPRTCIGMNFSLLQQKVFLCSLLKKFSEVKFGPGGKCEKRGTAFINTPNPDTLCFQFMRE